MSHRNIIFWFFCVCYILIPTFAKHNQSPGGKGIMGKFRKEMIGHLESLLEHGRKFVDALSKLWDDGSANKKIAALLDTYQMLTTLPSTIKEMYIVGQWSKSDRTMLQLANQMHQIQYMAGTKNATEDKNLEPARKILKKSVKILLKISKKDQVYKVYAQRIERAMKSVKTKADLIRIVNIIGTAGSEGKGAPKRLYMVMVHLSLLIISFCQMGIKVAAAPDNDSKSGITQYSIIAQTELKAVTHMMWQLSHDRYVSGFGQLSDNLKNASDTLYETKDPKVIVKALQNVENSVDEFLEANKNIFK